MIRAFTRSFWQAYREQRSVLLCAMLSVVFPVLLHGFVLESRSQVLFAAVVCPLFFVLASCAMLLSAEREAGTLNELQLMVPSRSGFLLGKAAWLLIGFVLLEVTTLYITDLLVPRRNRWDSINYPLLLLLGAVSLLEVLGWGLWFTSRCRTVIRALVYSAMVVLVIGVAFAAIFPMVELLAKPQSFGFDLGNIRKWLIVVLAIRLLFSILVLVEGSRSVWNELRVSTITRQDAQIRSRRWAIETLLNTHRLSVIAWQQTRVQRWAWLPLLFPFGITLILGFMSKETLDWLNLLLLVAPFVFASAFLGLFTTRYDLDGNRYEFFEQLGVPMRQVWKSRLLLSIPQWLLLLVCWFAMCSILGLPLIREEWSPVAYGDDFAFPTKASLMATTMLAGFLTLVASQYISLHVHRAVLAWMAIFLAATICTGLGVFWFALMGKALLWSVVGLIGLVFVLRSIQRSSVLISSRISMWDRATCCGFAALAPVGLCVMQYAHWLATGPPSLDSNTALVEPLTLEEVRALAAAGERFDEPIFHGKESRFWSVATLPAINRGWLTREKLLSEDDEEAAVLRRTFTDLLLSTQEAHDRDPQWRNTARSISDAEQVFRAMYRRTWNLLEDVPLADAIYGDSQYLKTSEERLAFCKAILEYDRFCDVFHIWSHGYARNVFGYALLWEWCNEPERTSDELEEVLAFLQQHGVWTPEDLLVKAYGQVRENFRYESALEGIRYADERWVPWVRALPGYREREHNWEQWVLWNATFGRHYELEIVDRFGLIQAQSEKKLESWLTVDGSAIFPRGPQGQALHPQRTPFEIAQFASGMFSIGARFPDRFDAYITSHYLIAFAQQLLEQRATEIRVAAKIYQLRHDGELPPSLDDLVHEEILDKLPIDPFTERPFVYRSMGPWRTITGPGVERRSDSESTALAFGEQRFLWSPGPNLIGRLSNSATQDFVYVLNRFAAKDQWELSEDRAFALGTSWSITNPARYPAYRFPTGPYSESLE